MSTQTRIPVNRDLITEQMHALGLSERAVIRETAVSQSQFRAARIEGWLPGTFTLVQLNQLADALGLTLPDLLTQDTGSTPGDQTTQVRKTPAKDAANVIPLLIGIDKNIPASSLRKALGWTPTRLDACLEAIDTALTGTGMRLHHGQRGTLRITPARPVTEEARTALRRMRASNHPITHGEASTLKRILDGQNVQDRDIANATKVHLGALKNLGCLALDEHAIYQPTAALLAAFPE